MPALHKAARWVGLVLFIAVSSLYLTSGLVAPLWAVGVLWVLWLILLVNLKNVWRNRPWMVLATPFVAFLIWAGAILAGDVFLGWTA